MRDFANMHLSYLSTKIIMNNRVLLIIGNGFDLDLGWKTSYKDFYLAKQHIYDWYNRNKFIENMVKKDAWYDLEGYLRTCALSLHSKVDVENFMAFYQICVNLIKDYLYDKTSAVYRNTRKDSCAYQLLSGISNETDVITFNYSDPFLQESLNAPKNLIHLHGSLMSGDAMANPILGFDEKTVEINRLIENSDAKDLIKSRKHNYRETFINLIKQADVIVIYGHSLSITDSDYFAPFLQNLSKGKLGNKKLYIVTYDNNAVINIRKNMEVYDVNYDDILYNSDTTTIFTSLGSNNDEFREMLKVCHF